MSGTPTVRGMHDPAVRVARLDRVGERHVARLSELVEELRAEQTDRAVPWFDPESGGAQARVLLLLEMPRPKVAPTPRGFRADLERVRLARQR
jgi:hypothetical protein